MYKKDFERNIMGICLKCVKCVRITISLFDVYLWVVFVTRCVRITISLFDVYLWVVFVRRCVRLQYRCLMCICESCLLRDDGHNTFNVKWRWLQYITIDVN